MRPRLLSLPLLLFLPAAALPGPAAAAQDDDYCTAMISAPTVISTPGVHCLDADIVMTPEQGDTGIVIDARDVVLDCRGHAIDDGDAPEQTYGTGVLSHAGAPRAVVRDCDIRGFLFGVLLYGGGTVEDNVMTGTGAEGIYVEGNRSIIRRNRIVDLGNSASGFQFAWGIVTFGHIDIIDNEIYGLTATPGGEHGAIGIVANDGFEPGRKFVIRGNRIGGMRPDTGKQAIGISTLSQGALVISDNVIHGDSGVDSIGVYCAYSTAPVALTRNDIYDFASPLVGCGTGSGNVTRP